MTYEEKYCLIVRAITDAKKFSGDLNNIDVPVNGNVGLWAVSIDDITKILKQIEQEGVLSIKRLPKPPFTTDVHYFVSVTNDFDNWSKKFLTNTLKRESMDKSNIQNQIEHRIEYTAIREIVLDGFIVLHKNNFADENDFVFEFLYNHPNESFTKADLEKAIKAKITKSFHKIVDNYRFKGDLKKLFFTVSEDTIMFRNPITKTDMEQLGITRVKL